MNKDSATKFTVSYFNNEICAFRALFGDKSFWAKSMDDRGMAVTALTFVYLNVECLTVDDKQHIECVFNATIAEYNNRASMMFMTAIRQTLGRVTA